MTERKQRLWLMALLAALVIAAVATKSKSEGPFTQRQWQIIEGWAQPVTIRQITITWVEHGESPPGPCESHRWVWLDLYNPNPYHTTYNYGDYVVTVDISPVFEERKVLNYHDFVEAQ